MTTSAPLFERTVPELRELCREAKLDSSGNKPDLIARLTKEAERVAAWTALLADPPTYEQGHRIVFDGGTVMPITLENYIPKPERFMMVKARYTVPIPFTRYPIEIEEWTTHSTVEGTIESVRHNIGANYPVAEYLPPGQKTRAELLAEVEELTRERNAYKRAKAENDDRFMTERDEARNERDSLRSVIEGRTTPPEDWEIAAHRSGEWLCDGRRVALYFSDDRDTVLRARIDENGRGENYVPNQETRAWLRQKAREGARWIPLDEEHRPCAGPTKGGSR